MMEVDKHYQLWKERKMSSPKNVTIWGVVGIIIGLCLIVAYYKVGKGALIAFGTMFLDRLGGASGDIAVALLLGLAAIGIIIWACVDARNMVK